ncbi:hypothetical protein TNIN_100681 [Trichonephila inaurata madagascariensis]|uniref:Uncharacterized protein n=1 Tax=Trichonephila inaurata madagascariensis TaxID=2747483 RepID=A0A8X6MAU9_9ARAC|nr:hypothetical protein TNIN_100681 [Trichonephila inaurata madagascariensis]
MRFQQDGATCHTTIETAQLQHESFPGRVIFRFGDRNWTAKSCDLVSLNFFLCSCLKPNKPMIISALKKEIECCVNEIKPHLCKIFMESFNKGVSMVQPISGIHLLDELYHI